MENDKENPDNLQDEDLQAEERQHKRMLWRRRLETSFSKALQKATEEFTWQEKADFLEAMIPIRAAFTKWRCLFERFLY